MIDGFNGYDQVSHYTIKEIEDALIGTKTWLGWGTKMSLLYNDSKENLNALFNYWN